jgi:hypothetical protein
MSSRLILGRVEFLAALGEVLSGLEQRVLEFGEPRAAGAHVGAV